MWLLALQALVRIDRALGVCLLPSLLGVASVSLGLRLVLPRGFVSTPLLLAPL